MSTSLKSASQTPILLRRLTEKPTVTPIQGGMTVVTTQGREAEMHDQQDDRTRYDRD